MPKEWKTELERAKERQRLTDRESNRWIQRKKRSIKTPITEIITEKLNEKED